MALQVVEFFGFIPLDPSASKYALEKRCPFIEGPCCKPNHGACSVQQLTAPEPIICCPNRMYADGYRMLTEIAESVFGGPVSLIKPGEAKGRPEEVIVFGHNWSQELPLPRPSGAKANKSRTYFVDWILAKVDGAGKVQDLTAIEVQTIDTTGNYGEQSKSFFSGEPFTDKQGRSPGYSNAGMNWENVNKRILPQVIYKGHVLRREAKCRKGLHFVCPKQVYERIIDRLGNRLHRYEPGNGTITFRSYELGGAEPAGSHRDLIFTDEFTTTVDQVALAFTSPMNLPDQNVYEQAIQKAVAASGAFPEGLLKLLG